MIRAALAIGSVALLAACSEPVAPRDVAGVYTAALGDGGAYRLEMGEDALYRFCRVDDPECTPPEDRGRYDVVRLGSTSKVRITLLCITAERDCGNYEADVRRVRPGTVEITLVDSDGASHVFAKD